MRNETYLESWTARDDLAMGSSYSYTAPNTLEMVHFGSRPRIVGERRRAASGVAKKREPGELSKPD